MGIQCIKVPLEVKVSFLQGASLSLSLDAKKLPFLLSLSIFWLSHPMAASEIGEKERKSGFFERLSCFGVYLYSV